MKLLFLLLSILLCTACGGDSGAPPDDPATLNSIHFARVCQDEVIPAAAVVNGGSDGIHPIIFYDNSLDGETYNLVFNSELELNAAWTVAVDGDYSIVELVGCISRVTSELVETCEYEFEETDDVGLLEIYDATYKLRVIAPRSGELVAVETIETYMDECPSFTFFADTGEVLSRYGRPHDQLANLVTDLVAP